MSETAAVTLPAAPAHIDAPFGPSVDGPAHDRGPLPGDPNQVDPFVFLAPDDPRRMMTDRQLRPFGVVDARILAAFDTVPRGVFIAKGFATVAYTDIPLRCVSGKRMLLAPMILGRMLQAAEPQPHHRALDVAGGSGYSACLLGRLVGEVVALESAAMESPFDLGDNVTRVAGPVTEGAKAKGPFDVIVVNGVIEIAPTALLEQLAEGGRLIVLEPHGPAVQGVRYDRIGGDFNRRLLFNASGPTLPEFVAPERFVF